MLLTFTSFLIYSLCVLGDIKALTKFNNTTFIKVNIEKGCCFRFSVTIAKPLYKKRLIIMMTVFLSGKCMSRYVWYITPIKYYIKSLISNSFFNFYFCPNNSLRYGYNFYNVTISIKTTEVNVKYLSILYGTELTYDVSIQMCTEDNYQEFVTFPYVNHGSKTIDKSIVNYVSNYPDEKIKLSWNIPQTIGYEIDYYYVLFVFDENSCILRATLDMNRLEKQYILRPLQEIPITCSMNESRVFPNTNPYIEIVTNNEVIDGAVSYILKLYYINAAKYGEIIQSNQTTGVYYSDNVRDLRVLNPDCDVVWRRPLHFNGQFYGYLLYYFNVTSVLKVHNCVYVLYNDTKKPKSNDKINCSAFHILKIMNLTSPVIVPNSVAQLESCEIYKICVFSWNIYGWSNGSCISKNPSQLSGESISPFSIIFIIFFSVMAFIVLIILVIVIKYYFCWTGADSHDSRFELMKKRFILRKPEVEMIVEPHVMRKPRYSRSNFERLNRRKTTGSLHHLPVIIDETSKANAYATPKSIQVTDSISNIIGPKHSRTRSSIIHK